MNKNKKLNDEILEKVNGGIPYNGSLNFLSSVTKKVSDGKEEAAVKTTGPLCKVKII